MNAIITTAAIAPLMAGPAVRAEQVTQLVMGETASVLEHSHDWLHLRTDLDHYDGWMHHGYARLLSREEVDGWRERASVWSEGVSVKLPDGPIHVPLRARLERAGDDVLLPDGRRGRVGTGALRSLEETVAANAVVTPEEWALVSYRGAPYLWGGITPYGVDCSGLVQTTFLARGIMLPRDAAQQAQAGEHVPHELIRPGDLLFFRSESGAPNITHVAFAARGDTIVHSTIAAGGVVHEPFTPGSRADDALRSRLVSARRIAAVKAEP